MSDTAAGDRSIKTVRIELEFLKDSGYMSSAEIEQVAHLLPKLHKVSNLPDIEKEVAMGEASDHRTSSDVEKDSDGIDGSRPATENLPSAIAQAAQNPNHPAHPKHPKHVEWASKVGFKLGSAAILGAGTTAGKELAVDSRR